MPHRFKIIRQILKTLLMLIPYLALFHFGLYRYFAARGSATHDLESTRHIAHGYPTAKFVQMGDSTASLGYLTNTINTFNRDKVINLSLSGSGFLSHYKLAGEFGRPDHIAILILSPDNFLKGDHASLLRDLEQQKIYLAFTDAYPIWYLSNTPRDFFTNLAGLAFRPFLYQKDFEDFAQNPVKRLREVQGNYRWLTHPVLPTDPVGENVWEMDVCGIEDLEAIPARLKALPADAPPTERHRLKVIWESYVYRLFQKEIDPLGVNKLSFLLDRLSGSFEHVYIFSAPVYKGFAGVYPTTYEQQIEAIIARASQDFANVTYVPRQENICEDPHYFRDVVHLNRKGAAWCTLYLADYIQRYSGISLDPPARTRLMDLYNQDPIPPFLPPGTSVIGSPGIR